MTYYTWVPIDGEGRHTGFAARGLLTSMEQAYEYMQPFQPHETDFLPYPSWIVKGGQGYWLTAIHI